MSNVDTIFNIKRVYSNLFLAKPFLERKGVYSAEKLLEEIKKAQKSMGFKIGKDEDGLSLTDIIQDAFTDAREQHQLSQGERSKVSRLNKYHSYIDILLQELGKDGRENPFHEKIPIFINGLCITDEGLMQKEGIDPYGNNHIFSNLLLDLLPNFFPNEFLDMLRFVYVQPIPYTQRTVIRRIEHEKDDDNREGDIQFGLEDILRERILKKINQEGRIGFGTLEKYDYTTPKIGNSFYHSDMFDARQLHSRIANNPDNYADEAMHNGKLDWQWFLQKQQITAYVNKQIMAIKFAMIRDMIFPHVIDTLLDYHIDSIPLYMEKTSSSSEIMQITNDYVDIPFDLEFIGGKDGILANAPDRLPKAGICHPTAIGRLFGFMESIYMKWTGGKQIFMPKTKQEKKTNILVYESSGTFPWLLLENDTHKENPNLHDLAIEHLSQYEIGLLEALAKIHRVGFTRVEPRIVALKNTDFNVYKGLRSINKENIRWFTESRDKNWLTPDKIPGFMSMQSISEMAGDFRGSELSYPIGPKLSQRWIEDFHDGKADMGCSIAPVLGRIERTYARKLLAEQLKHEDEHKVKEFFRHVNPDTLESIYAVRGTAAHNLFSMPLEGLVHYDTLNLAGIEPVSSDKYTETPLVTTIFSKTKYGGIQFQATFHPDVYLFMERGDNNYDLIVIDRKTNRATPYPEHKYLMQTLFYGWMLSDIVKKELGIDVINIYTMLDKNAFYKGFGDNDVITYPHTTYRTPKFSPITLWTPDDPLREIIPDVVGTIQAEKQMIINEPSSIIDMKKQHEAKGLCDKCYSETRFLCNYMRDSLKRKEDVAVHLNQTT
ncbi:MAG: hypothetical protein ACMXYG_06600 [Candidatus Woesearchaeota archaeon]